MISNVIAGIAIALNQSLGMIMNLYRGNKAGLERALLFYYPLKSIQDRFPIQTVFDGQSILYTVFPGIGGQSE